MTLHEFIEGLQEIEKKYDASDWDLQREVFLINDDDEYTYQDDLEEFTIEDLRIQEKNKRVVIPVEFNYADEDEDENDEYDDF